MPRINEWQRRRLASQVVQIPSVDSGSVDLFNAAARALGGVADAFQAKEDKEALAAEKQKQAIETAFRNQQAQKNIIQLKTDIEKYTLSFKQENAENPVGLEGRYKEGIDELINGRLDNLDDEEVRGIVETKIYGDMDEKMVSFVNWQSTQQISESLRTFDDIKDSLKAKTYQAGKIGGEEGFQEFVNIIRKDFPDLIATNSLLLGEKELSGVQTKFPKELAEVFITGLAEMRAEEARNYLNEQVFDDLLGEDKQKLVDRVDSLYKNQAERFKTNRLAEQASLHGDIYDQYLDNNLSLVELDIERQKRPEDKEFQEFADSLEQLITKKDKKKLRPLPERAKKMSDLEARKKRFVIHKEDHEEVGSGAASDYILFQKDVLQAEKDGYLKEGEAATLIKAVAKPMRDAIEAEEGTEKGWFGREKPNDPYDQGFDIIQQTLVKNNKQDDYLLKRELMMEYVQEADNLGVLQLEGDQRKKAMQESAKRAINNVAERLYPDLALIEDEEKPKSVLDKSGGLFSTGSSGKKAKATKSLPVKYKIKKYSNGKFKIHYENGESEVISEERAKELGAKI